MNKQEMVESAISNAALRMSPEYMAHLDRLAPGARGKGGKGAAMGTSDISALDAQVFGYSTPSSQAQAPRIMQEQSEPRQFSNDILRESFAQTPPISGNNFPGAENMGNTPSGYVPGASLLREQRVASQQPYVQQPTYVQQPQYIPQQVGGGIDYNMIKYLVSEAVKENIAEIKQSILNESTLRGINMPGGNKIQFLDNKGNLYEAQLTLKKKKQ